MKKHLSLYLFFVAISTIFFLSISPVFGQTTKSFELTITDIHASNGMVQGTLHINNPNSLPYENLSYTERLLAPDITETREVNGQMATVVSSGPLIAYKNSPTFRLGANQTIDFSISLPYSTAVASGNYSLQIALSDNNGKLLGITKESVELKGTDSFMQFVTCSIVAEGEEYSPTIGPNVSPKAPVYGTCQITNPTTTDMLVYPRSTYAINQVIGNPESEKKTISSDIQTMIPAGGTKTVRFPLPALETPQVYEALSFLVDSQNVQVSPQIAFRWVVAGPSSTIRSLIIDKRSYNPGSTAKVTVAADPSMDLYWRIGGSPKIEFPMIEKKTHFQPKLKGTPLTDPKLFVSITDKNGVLCGEKEQKITAPSDVPSWPDQIVPVSIEKDCSGAQVAAVVKNGDTVLAKKSTAGFSSIATEPSGTGKNTLYLWGVLVILVIVSVGMGVWWYIKKKKAAAPLAIIFISIITFITVIRLPAVYAQTATPTVTPTASPSPSPSPTGAVPSSTPTVTTTPTGTTPTTTITPAVKPLEQKPGQPLNVTYSSITIDHQSCEPWGGWTKVPEPTGGKCTVNATWSDKVNFDFLDTQDQFVFSDNDIKARVSGRLSVIGCENTHAGLLIRAYVDGTNEGVKINGGTSKLILTNLVNIAHGGTSAEKDIIQDLTITPGIQLACGKHKVKLELIPFLIHADQVSTDPSEDPHYPNQNGHTVTYGGRVNCGGTEPCWGVLEKEVVKPCACNEGCTVPGDCANNKEGCTSCRSSSTTSGSALTCQPPIPPACGATCTNDDECTKAVDGCTVCGKTGKNAGKCVTANMCNKACTTPADCENTRDACTACLPNDTGSGSSCKPVPACGTSCTKDSQCAGAKNGCNLCNEAGKCSAFSPDMCKCDGMDFSVAGGKSTFFPGDDVSFIAFGKVEGANINVADLQSMTFSLYQSNLSNPNNATRLAQSTAIKPEIVQNDPTKVRYKVTWNQKIPSTVPSGSLFRVQATIKCAAKPGVLGASIKQEPNYYANLAQTIQGLMTNTKVVLGDTTRELQQAETFYPGAKISEKSCSIIKFYFE